MERLYHDYFKTLLQNDDYINLLGENVNMQKKLQRNFIRR